MTNQQVIKSRKRLLIFGGGGLLGHKVWQRLSSRFDTFATLRTVSNEVAATEWFREERVWSGVDATDLTGMAKVLQEVRPDVVINCIGIVKQHPAANDPIASITVNALVPHHLAQACASVGARLIHVSTDCVFSGRKGMYVETDFPDATDLYGRTKVLGELSGRRDCLTIRTSIVGRSLHDGYGLIDWFLSNRGGRVEGYTTAVFSGLTTISLADLLGDVVERCPSLSGVYHVGSEPIDKYSLLILLNEAYQADVKITPRSTVPVNRSLDSRRFRKQVGWAPHAWREMIAQMAADPTPYDTWRPR